MECIEINLSKFKISLMLIAGITFTVLGFLILFDYQLTKFNEGHSLFIRLIGLLCILFFGIGSFYIARKIFDTKPGLIINDNGIVDNSSAMSVGLIKWDDIIGIEKYEISSNKFLLILVNNPQYYIDKSENIIVKKSLTWNNENYGSPISIIAHSLKININDLEDIIVERFELKNHK